MNAVISDDRVKARIVVSDQAASEQILRRAGQDIASALSSLSGGALVSQGIGFWVVGADRDELSGPSECSHAIVVDVSVYSWQRSALERIIKQSVAQSCNTHALNVRWVHVEFTTHQAGHFSIADA